MNISKFVVGLTGGIGSGKSEVCMRFAKRGISIIDADIVAREVVEPGRDALAQIQLHFGDAILEPTGKLNRRKLRSIIFADAIEKEWLESLLHPLINTEVRRQLSLAKSAYSILASPLLLETTQFQLANRVLVIDAREELQIERARHRDANSDVQIRAIMRTQLSRQERCARAHDIIHNHGDLNELDAQIEKLHQFYLKLAHSTDQLN